MVSVGGRVRGNKWFCSIYFGSAFRTYFPSALVVVVFVRGCGIGGRYVWGGVLGDEIFEGGYD